MSPQQIAAMLIQTGIKDITSELDFKRCSHESFAHGGFGSIHHGALRDGQLVAIKCIEMLGQWGAWSPSDKHWKHAAHELYAWSKCDHPGIMKAIGFVFYKDAILLVSPWAQNGSLAHYLGSGSVCDKLRFCIELASSLEYLHGIGIVHGDVKAENIVVSDSGSTQLVDFGSATFIHGFTLCFTRTSRSLPFTIRFTAPEILDGINDKHTVETDIYALGMTLLQIATGEPPYAGKSDLAVLSHVFRNILPHRPDFDDIISDQPEKDKLWNLLIRCWEQDPKLRPTATEVKDALIEIKEMSIAQPECSWNSNRVIGRRA
ncbi:kinase-like protein, partial [Rhizoctonia solani]